MKHTVLSDLRLLLRLTPFDTSTVEGRSYERYRRITLTTLSNVFSRGVGTSVGIITVPLLVTYLGKEMYGLWVAITALVAWVAIFDFGIVNGLVNVIAEAHGKDDREAAARYVSTAFFVVTTIALTCWLVFVLALPVIPWETILAADGVATRNMLRLGVLAAGTCFFFGLPLSIVRQIYEGYQAAYISSLIAAAGSLLTLFGIVAVVRLGGSLPVLIFVYGGANLLILLWNLWLVTSHQMPWLRLSLQRCSRSALQRIWRISLPLFLFQIGALLINQSQALVLAHRTDLSTVAEYAVLMQVYLWVASFISMSTNSFVPSFREAYERGDLAWMRLSFKRLLLLRLVLAIASGGLFMAAGNILLQFWLRRTDITYDSAVWFCLGILLISSMWVSAYSDLLRILDQIWMLVALVLVNGVVTVLLTYTLAPALGVLGAVVASAAVTVLVWTWLLPVLTEQIIPTRPTQVSGSAAHDVTVSPIT